MDKVRVHDDLGLDVQRQDGLWLEPSQAHIKLIRLREGSGVCVYYCSRNHTTPTIAATSYYTVASATSPTISTGPTATKIAPDHTNPYLCSCQSYHHRTTTTTTAFNRPLHLPPPLLMPRQLDSPYSTATTITTTATTTTTCVATPTAASTVM